MVVAQALVCIAALGLPLYGAARSVWMGATSAEEIGHAFEMIDAAMLARTLWIALAIAGTATAFALPAAWAMRRLPARSAALLLAPMLLPNYLVYVAWGQLRAPGTWLGDALERADSPALWNAAGIAQSIGGLALWAWPIGALVLAASARRVDRETIEALRLSGGSRLRRAVVVLGEMRGGILASVGVLTLLMIGSAVPLHVSQIETYSIVVWRAMMETSQIAPVWIVASPLIVFAALVGIGLGIVLIRMDDSAIGVDCDERVGVGWLVGAGAIWCASTIVPLVMFIASLREFGSLWRRASSVFGDGALADTLEVGAIVAGVCLLVMAGVAIGLSSGRAWMRRLTHISVCAWVAGAAVPGVLIGFGIVAASYAGATAWIGDSAAGIVWAQVARLGGVGAVAGWWLARVESPILRDARRLYAGDGIRAWWASSGRAQAVTAIGIFLAIALLSAHEIEATAVVGAPGTGTLAQRMLDKLHYLREEELKVAAACMMGVGLLAGLAVFALTAAGRAGFGRAARMLALALLTCAMTGSMGGCERRTESAAVLPDARSIGERGTMSGQLFIPRVIDTDGRYLWVADKTDRVQRFDPETGKGVIAWHVQSIVDPGRPCGLTVGPDGLIYVADTHQHRVCVVRPEADGHTERVAIFGAYGRDGGRFLYPTDVALIPGPDGKTIERIYVSEYGGNDRISVFDASYNFLFSFGSEGSSGDSDNIQFERPQSIEWDAQNGELIVTDAVNHRVGRFTRDGALIAWMGAGGGTSARKGSDLGAFDYPYGLVLLGDGKALVSEFGNNRVQMIDYERGVGLATFGETGRGPGQLANPWAVTVIGRRAYVTDTGNHRIQSFALPRSVAGL